VPCSGTGSSLVPDTARAKWFSRAVGLNAAAAAELTAFGVEIVTLKIDVTDADQVQRMVADTVAALGGLDILVANAGMNTVKDAVDLRPDEWRQIIDLNLSGVFYCAQAAGRGARRTNSDAA